MSEVATSCPPRASGWLADLPGFVQLNWYSLPGSQVGDAPACIIDFDLSAFKRSAFESAGIACPADIAASVPKRQADYFFGRLAACLALEVLGYTGVDVLSGVIRAPIWPHGVMGSISHSSGQAAAVAWARRGRRGIGLDIEAPVDDAALESLLKLVVDGSERSCAELAPMDGRHAMTLIFSAKESLFKAASASVGRFFGFEAARLSVFDVERHCLWLKIQEDLGPQLALGSLHKVDFVLLDNGHVLTSCVW